MNEKTDSQIIHEARGKVWHTLGIDRGSGCVCGWEPSTCMVVSMHADALNPDYARPTAYREATKDLSKKEWWPEFCNEVYLYGASYRSWEFAEIMLDCEKGSHKIAEYIKEEVRENDDA